MGKEHRQKQMRRQEDSWEGRDQTWAVRIRSLHGCPLSPLRIASAATPCAAAVVVAALCAASIARIVANSRRRAATCIRDVRWSGWGVAMQQGGKVASVLDGKRRSLMGAGRRGARGGESRETDLTWWELHAGIEFLKFTSTLMLFMGIEDV